jgi:hypothetical protein
MNHANAPTVLGMLHKQITSELGTSEITVKILREGGSEFYGSVARAPLRDGMGKLLDLVLFTPERLIMLEQGGKYGEPCASHDTH